MKTRQFAFHDRVSPTPPDLLQGKTPKQFITLTYASKGYDSNKTSLSNEGVVRLGGWLFDFREHLREFIVHQHGYLSSVFAPNRTSIRSVMYGRFTILAETDHSKKQAIATKNKASE